MVSDQRVFGIDAAQVSDSRSASPASSFHVADAVWSKCTSSSIGPHQNAGVLRRKCLPAGAGAGDFHQSDAGRQVGGAWRHLEDGLASAPLRAHLEVGHIAWLRKRGGSEIGSGLEACRRLSGRCGSNRGCRAPSGRRQLWLELDSGLEFALGDAPYLFALRPARPGPGGYPARS